MAQPLEIQQHAEVMRLLSTMKKADGYDFDLNDRNISGYLRTITDIAAADTPHLCVAIGDDRYQGDKVKFKTYLVRREIAVLGIVRADKTKVVSVLAQLLRCTIHRLLSNPRLIPGGPGVAGNAMVRNMWVESVARTTSRIALEDWAAFDLTLLAECDVKWDQLATI